MATSTDDFFRSRLDQMIDLRHPLAVLASRMPWQEIEASLSHRFARAAKAGKQIEDIDLFGATVSLSGAGISKAGRPRLPLRLMVSLLYLKHAFNESDEALVERWGETPTWQYFSGLAYFEHRWPCDPTLLVKFRKLIGEEGVQELLARTIEVAVSLKPSPTPPTASYCKRHAPSSSSLPKKRESPSNKPTPKKAKCWATGQGATPTPVSTSACAKSSNASAPSWAACSAKWAAR